MGFGALAPLVEKESRNRYPPNNTTAGQTPCIYKSASSQPQFLNQIFGDRAFTFSEDLALDAR